MVIDYFSYTSNGQGINPNSPNNLPLSPNVPNPGATLAPGTSQPAPQR